MKIEDYDELYRAQGGLCAICGKSEIAMIWASRGRTKVSHLAVDHDHETGAIRGLLCARCNHMLGAAKDKASTLWAAVQYLAAAWRLEERPELICDDATALFIADAEDRGISIREYAQYNGIILGPLTRSRYSLGEIGRRVGAARITPEQRCQTPPTTG